MTEKIQENEISFVVQGPIYGAKSENPNEQYTRRCLESIRKFFPTSEIVLSTWKGVDVSGLDYDTLVLNKDPGATIWHESKKLYNNTNRQIVSTKNGLKKAKGKYAVKLRADTILLSKGFLDYFGTFEKYSKSKILKNRVIISLAGSLVPQRHGTIFHLSDIFLFGYRTDLIDIWDIPLTKEPGFSTWYKGKPGNLNPKGFLYRYVSEQYLWLTFFRKHHKLEYEVDKKPTEEQIKLFEDFVANNVVPVSMNKLAIKMLKYPPANFLQIVDYSGYTSMEWIKLYNKYCSANLKTSTNLLLLEKKLLHAIAALIPNSIKVNFLGKPKD
ncbi:MAG: WavE lipopolysaccharide synthesis family protein [archaeon]